MLLASQYYDLLSNLAAGTHADEEAISHQRIAIDLLDGIEDAAADQLHGQLAIVNLLAYADPSASEAEAILESAESTLWVPEYAFEEWPLAEETPSYLDLLHAKISLRLEQGALEEAAEIGDAILNRFYPSPYIADNVVSMHSIAEVHARDHQAEQMEKFLSRAAKLMERHNVKWYLFDADRIRAICKDEA
jgi:hypothetical protein